MSASKISVPSGMLNLADIVKRTGFDRSALTRFLSSRETRRWLGGEETHPLYPADRLDRFQQMHQESQRGVKPAAFALLVASRSAGIVTDPRIDLTAAEPLADHRRSDDRFLTVDQAAELLACKKSEVEKHVKPVLPGRWSHLDLQEFMAEARRKARAASAS